MGGAVNNEILDNIDYSEDGGALLYNGVRYMLIRPETVLEMFKAITDEVGHEKAGQVFYRSGHRGGSLSATHFRREMGLSPEEIVRFMAKMGGQLGWGRIEINSLNVDDGFLELDVYHSVFSEEFGQAEMPVCHMIRGVFAGTWSGSIDKDVDGLETRCRAVDGPGPCSFIFSPAKAGSMNVPFSPM